MSLKTFIILLMDPNNRPAPAPPAGHNPYEFITNPAKPAKRSLLPAGGKKQRLIIVAVAAVIFITIILVFVSLLSSSGSIKPDYQSLVQQQTELIRISEIGRTKAAGADARNLAVNTSYTISTQQNNLEPIAKKAGAKTDKKTLGLGKNPKTDSALDDAAQANNFDSVFITTMQDSLKKYQQTLKKIYDHTNSKSSKEKLSNAYNDTSLLLAQ